MRTIALLGLAAALNLGVGRLGPEAGAPGNGLQQDHPRPAVRLKPGDTVAVTSPYGGEFRLMPDGAIYGRGFGRLLLEGKTWEEAQAAMRKALAAYVRSDDVHLTLRDLRREVVFLVGMSGGRGPIELQPNLTLRQLLALAPLDANADLLQVQLFRAGSKRCDYNVAKLVAGDSATPDLALMADDVVTLSPAAFVRVWVTGLAARTGRLTLPAGTDVYRAIAEAGGVKWPELDTDPGWQQYGKVVVQRGPDRREFPMRDAGGAPFALESGDTISILAPEEARVTFAGEVLRPGEIVLRGDRSLAAGLARAGGSTPEGTLVGLRVLRKGELFQIDASAAPNGKNGFDLEGGDLVFVSRNERSFLALGEVAKPGKILMKDGRAYRMSDALAEAGGLSGRGTLRRVFLCRPDSSGKVRASQFNLDEFLRDGRLESNPQILPGDCLLFGQPQGFTLGTAVQVVSGIVLLEAVGGGKR